MAQVGAQCKHVASNLILATVTCLERTNGEGVPHVMNARTCASGTTAQADGASQFQEHCIDGRVGKSCSPQRDEDGTVIAANPFSAGQVTIQPLLDRGVQWYKAGLAELGVSDE